jgi:hypothetical protein
VEPSASVDSGQLRFIRWLRTGRSLPILGRLGGPVAVKSAVKREKAPDFSGASSV